MTLGFNPLLADTLRIFADAVQTSEQRRAEFVEDPTGVATKFLEDNGVPIPFGFHAHVGTSVKDLPDEPDKATRERYIYIYDLGGEFQYKKVSGSPHGNDKMFVSPEGACQCCNCAWFCIPL